LKQRGKSAPKKKRTAPVGKFEMVAGDELPLTRHSKGDNWRQEEVVDGRDLEGEHQMATPIWSLVRKGCKISWRDLSRIGITGIDQAGDDALCINFKSVVSQSCTRQYDICLADFSVTGVG
jgi:hypothetical protein